MITTASPAKCGRPARTAIPNPCGPWLSTRRIAESEQPRATTQSRVASRLPSSTTMTSYAMLSPRSFVMISVMVSTMEPSSSRAGITIDNMALYGDLGFRAPVLPFHDLRQNYRKVELERPVREMASGLGEIRHVAHIVADAIGVFIFVV